MIRRAYNGRMRAFAALAACLALACAAADPPRCRLAQTAEWPVKLQGGQPVVEGEINGHRIGVLLDTGAYASVITKSAAEKLDLWTRATPEMIVGFGGTSRVLV